MDSDYQKLLDLFTSDPTSAITECQKIICSVSKFDDFKDFYNYHLENSHMSMCQNEWNQSQLCIYCRDCSIIHPACVCLPCFLNGNHEGHNYVLLSCTGNCDCGDALHWKRSGFCSEHHGLNDDNPEKYLDENLQNVLTDVIFKAAFSSLKHFTHQNTENASNIIQFISSFLKFGDGFRRLISRSLTERIDLESLMLGIPEYSSEFNHILQQLCGGLINDQLFRQNFSSIAYKIFDSRIIKETKNMIISGSKNISYDVWNHFWFHAFSEFMIRYNIEQKNWDWVSFYVKILQQAKEILSFIGDDSYNEYPKAIVDVISRVEDATKVQPNEQTQKFFDRVVMEVLSSGSQSGIEKGKSNDNIIIASFKESTEQRYFFPFFHFTLLFYEFFNCFAKKPNLKIDKLFEQLDKLVDISPIFMIGKNSVGESLENENDKFVARFLNQKENSEDFQATNYKSFHNGASLFLSYPLIEAISSLFKVDLTLQVKIARLLSDQKYQNLRVKLGISTLKNVISHICHRQSIASVSNRSLLFIYDIYSKADMITKYFIKFVPILQLLIGLQCANETSNYEFSLKEFFAFESAREIGLFDNFEGSDYLDENVTEKQKQMIFSFLYFSLLLVIERTLFYYNGFGIMREQIIFALKNGIHSIEDLNGLYDTSALDSMNYMWAFNEVLMKVASTTNQNENKEASKSNQKDVSFYLKEGVEWKSISAINSINETMTLMNNEITKNSDQLIKIPEFEPEETFFFHSHKEIKYTQVSEDQNDDDNDNENIDTEGLNVNLKQFLLTPTVLAVVYHSLRTNSGIDSMNSDLNDHLAMNVLIFIAQFIKEQKDEQSSSSSSFDESTTIQYESFVDLIAKLKRIVFNYRVDEKGNAFIENTLNQKSFISLLKMKMSSKNLPAKSFIDILLNKGKLGRTVLQQISSHIHIDSVEGLDEQANKDQDINAIKRQKAAKLKEKIMSHFKNQISNYKDSVDSVDEIASVSNSENISAENKEVCSICSTFKKNEVFAYPLFMYRTKFPFIVDKPPLVKKDSPYRAVDSNEEDFDIPEQEQSNDDNNKNRSNSNNIGEEEEEESIDFDPQAAISIIMQNFPDLMETDGLSEEEAEERRNTFDAIMRTILEEQMQRHNKKKERSGFTDDLLKFQKDEKEANDKIAEKSEFKRCTSGSNFVVQFGICQHPVHMNCVKDKVFTCPIDRSLKNGLLPSLDEHPKSVIFADTKTFEVKNDDKKDTLTKSAIDSITSFLSNFESFFKDPQNIFVELLKSICGTISTYEIRLRNLPDCLDSLKTKYLARNLFLTVWCAYRMRGKPEIAENDDLLTMFQRFVRKAIESDAIEMNDDEESKVNEIKKIVSSILSGNKDDDRVVCLFLRRVCLAEYFLFNNNVQSAAGLQDIIDWDDVLSPANLANRYGVKFASIDVSNEEEFEFKPFTFCELPKQFLHLAKLPFNFPIEKTKVTTVFNLTDYNYLIRKYDEASGEIVNDDAEEEAAKNQRDLANFDQEFIADFLKEFYGNRHYPSVILFVGNSVSLAFLVCQDYFALLDPFYVDKYGCNDVDYKRNQPLFLNEEKYDRVTDLLLSGDFAYFLRPIDRLR